MNLSQFEYILLRMFALISELCYLLLTIPGLFLDMHQDRE